MTKTDEKSFQVKNENPQPDKTPFPASLVIKTGGKVRG